MKKLSFFILILVFGSCVEQKSTEEFIGYWQGPHPTDQEKKFYVHIQNVNDTFRAQGYWTLNNFYQSVFNIESVELSNDSIRFYVPDWACNYIGKLAKGEIIEGGFNCLNEPFDTVNLIKNKTASKYLTLPKADFHENDKYAYQAPEQRDELIETSSANSLSDSLFIEKLMNEIINGNYGRINSFLLIKNNKLICEEYFFGYTRNDLHPIESTTKSITSLLIGIAKDQGKVTDIHQPLYAIFPNYTNLQNGNYKKIKMQDLLTMSSGFESNDRELFHSGNNRIEFALQRKLTRKPGEKFVYDGGNTEILGAIIREKTGMYADEFADKFLFKPLGINDYNWEIYKQDGYPSMAGSLWLKPIDMARIGLLVINKGMFAGQQIISENWIRESTTKKIETHIQDDDYAYHWWNMNLKSKEKIYNCIWANGWGSQFIYIIPELGVVMVTTGYNYENDSWAITAGIERYLYLLDYK